MIKEEETRLKESDRWEKAANKKIVGIKTMRCIINQELSKSFVTQLSWESGHRFLFQNEKIIFNTNCIRLLENFGIYRHGDKRLLSNEQLLSNENIVTD